MASSETPTDPTSTQPVPESIPAGPGTAALPGVRRTRPEVTSQSLANNSEFTLIMPVKPGFVPIRDTITYATRARLLMRAFNGFRKLSREAVDLHPFADVVERISTIQSYRLNLLENDTKLMLAVSFDQPWEPYIRNIWRDTGPFLDAILCNCLDYERYASDKGFEAFSAWVRKTQVETDFFYIADNLTVADRKYLDITEQRMREGRVADRELAITQTRKPDIDKTAELERRRDPRESLFTGLRALGVLYRLNDYYPATAGSSDHLYYRHAVRRLLYGFETDEIPEPLRQDFKAELEWFEQDIIPPVKPRERDEPADHKIQAGILKPYPAVSHGVLLLMRIVNPHRAAEFIRRIPVTSNGNEPGEGQPAFNIAFTYPGLVQMQVDPEDLAELPQEFREGMAARAGMIGDVRSNHPSNWRLPTRFGHNEHTDPVKASQIQMSSVDFVVQLRISKPDQPYTTQWNGDHPLFDAVARLQPQTAVDGVQLLALQPMGHQRDAESQRIREHFGFIDGISQPDLRAHPETLGNKVWSNEAALGDVLLGHRNSHGDPAYPESRYDTFTDNGSFLVVRKLKQDVAQFNKVLPNKPQAAERVREKLMGRNREGTPLASYNNEITQNDFDFNDDLLGDRCPIHAHIRRANPREVKKVAGYDREGRIRPPRIVRRGMSYGPKYTPQTSKAERGLIFMGYNASIAEQFEVIQRWLSGGNSTGGYSGQADPFIGVPEHGRQRTIRYVDEGRGARKIIKRIKIDDADAAKPFVRLEWGLYLFVPSMRTLRHLIKPVGRRNLASKGEEIIKRLRQVADIQKIVKPVPPEVPVLDQWKAVLEDLHPSMEEDLDAVWAAIRQNHGGVLRTPYGVLVANEDLVREVFGDDGSRFSVRRYWWRLREAFGDIYLSMDPNPKAYPGEQDPTQPHDQLPYHEQVKADDYRDRSRAINELLNGFSEQWAFEQAHQAATEYLNSRPRKLQGNLRIRTLVNQVLGTVAKDWFGIPDGEEIIVAGEPTAESSPDSLHCPFHFIASSRFAFSPRPGPAAVAEGKDHGSRLQATTEAWVRSLNGDPANNPTPIGGPMFDLLGHDPARLASELIGVMHGFLPSTLGNLLQAISIWIDDGNLWRMQEDYLSSSRTDPLSRANDALRDPLMRALQYRPVPDQLHRVVVDEGIQLGPEQLKPGDRMVVGIGSASQALLDAGKTDVTWVFGGDYCPVYDDDSDSTAEPTENRGAHGCPGQKIAMGTMLGTVAALMEAGQIRAEPATLILTLL